MLILTRQIGESIIIGDDVVIKLLKITRRNARIGISASKSVPIYREEIYRKIQQELMNNDE